MPSTVDSLSYWGSMHSASAILARTQFESGPKLVNSYLNDIFFARCTLHQLLLEKLESARSSTQKIFDHQTLQSFSYRELAQLIRKTATAFAEQFLIPGDYVIFIGSNCMEYVSLYFGAICVGVIPITIPQANVSLQDIKTQIIQHNIQYLVVSSELDSLWIKKLLNSVTSISKIIIYNQESRNPFQRTHLHDSEEIEQLLKNPKLVTYFDFIQNANISPISDDDLYQPKNIFASTCLAINSSGNSQWPPKILLHGHYSLVAAIEVLCHTSVLDYRCIDKFLVYGSFENMPNLLMFLTGVFFGCNVILLPSYNFKTIIESICDHRINLAWFTANTIMKLVKTHKFDAEKLSPLANLTKVVSFGGKVPAGMCKEFLQLYPSVKSLRHCYLISESAIPVSMMILNSHDYDSVGFVLPNSRVKIISDPKNPESMCAANMHGFVCVEREPELFAIGYLNQYSHHLMPLIFEPQEGDASSASLASPIVVSPPNKSNRRWYQTDDVGYYDDEGLIYVYGKWFSTLGPSTGVLARVQENELQAILLMHPAVEEVSLILKQDHTWAAAVVAKEYSTTKLPKLSKELGEFLNSKLSSSSILSQSQANVTNIFIKYSLPKTASGKVIRCLIRDEVQNLLNIKRKF